MRGDSMKENRFMKMVLCLMAAGLVFTGTAFAEEAAEELEPEVCFESRGMKEDGEVTGYTILEKRDIAVWWPNVKCSPKTGGVLWWGDPFDETVPMIDDTDPTTNMPIEADYTHEEAVVKSREAFLTDVIGLYPCADMCHGAEAEVVAIPKTTTPRVLAEMHLEKFKNETGEPKDLQHGRGAIWCLDCHSRTNRNRLIDHRGNEISFNQPMKLCGKCHGPVYRDWRDGIHGKRIGMWTKGGKKRWWVCTECHDPHNVQQAPGSRGFAQLAPEPAPALPKGMKNANHEQEHGGGHGGGPAPAGGEAPAH